MRVEITKTVDCIKKLNDTIGTRLGGLDREILSTLSARFGGDIDAEGGAEAKVSVRSDWR